MEKENFKAFYDQLVIVINIVLQPQVIFLINFSSLIKLIEKNEKLDEFMEYAIQQIR